MNENENTITLTDPKEIALCAVKLLDAKKASAIKCLHIEDKTIIADYFVICKGSSNTQIRALAGELEEKLGEMGVKLLRSEGYNEAVWTVLDFGSVIVHIFDRQSHDFYKLDKLWNDAEEVDISEYITK